MTIDRDPNPGKDVARLAIDDVLANRMGQSRAALINRAIYELATV
jgi:hypothetical protein